jgi:type III secretion protein J
MRTAGIITVALGAFALSGCGVELEHGLDERQANEVTAVLESSGIAADKIAEDNNANAYKIVVPRAEAGRAFSLLESRDLPRRAMRGLSDTFAGGTLLPSPVEDRARYAAALAVELERSLEEIPGVVSARVHLALPA